MTTQPTNSSDIYTQLAANIKQWGAELGFQDLLITDTDLSEETPRLQEWLNKNYHGSMGWMAENFNKRTQPAELVPNTIRVISVRLNYLPADTQQIKILKSADKAYISRYALGRDYHKLMRKRLALLAKKIETAANIAGINQRAFVDSAPVMERPLAAKAGLGWIGKHTLLLTRDQGSWFFLGEILTSLPLPIDNTQQKNECGECSACLKVCPTDAFPRPYQLNATRCISYLTIENDGPIPMEFREAIGNRVFGCDDCQAICPWNKFAKATDEKDFQPRHQLDNSELTTLFLWDETTFLKNTEGSPIRRIGFERWLRNLAIGLGNAPQSENVKTALTSRLSHSSPMVQEHIEWALLRQQSSRPRKRKVAAQSVNVPPDKNI